MTSDDTFAGMECGAFGRKEERAKCENTMIHKCVKMPLVLHEFRWVNTLEGPGESQRHYHITHLDPFFS